MKKTHSAARTQPHRTLSTMKIYVLCLCMNNGYSRYIPYHDQGMKTMMEKCYNILTCMNYFEKDIRFQNDFPTLQLKATVPRTLLLATLKPSSASSSLFLTQLLSSPSPTSRLPHPPPVLGYLRCLLRKPLNNSAKCETNHFAVYA